MKQSLQTKMNQQLTMTPQLQQAIRLLQLSSLELEKEIQEMLESNPLLEKDRDNDQREDTDMESAVDDDVDVEKLSAEEVDEWERGYETAPSKGASKASNSGDDRRTEIADTDGESLREHLLWQLHLSKTTAKDRAIAAAIIDAIDDDGYLTESLSVIQETVAPDFRVSEDDIEVVRHRIQHFEPLGSASRSLQDSLTLQLSMLPDDTPHVEKARELAANHLPLLGRQNVKKLAKAMDVDQEELDGIVALIREMKPRPGSAIGGGDTEYIKPDAYARKSDGDWEVVLNPKAMAKLKINRYYASLIEKAKKADASFIRNNLQEARWFIKSLQTRNETLLKVARCIVDFQREFFEYGPVAMKPLVLRDVAEAVDMHESTISRVTTRKYLHSPRGIFEFKYFFSSHVSTSDGGECSATAIRAMIADMIENEPPGKPLSDSKLAKALNARGIEVARRTVAKYREALGIPSSTDRKRVI